MTVQLAGEAPELVIVGYRHGTHIGGSLARAADRLGIHYEFIDASAAFKVPRVVRAISWRFAGHRPPALRRTSQAALAACRHWRPRWLLTTGMAPIDGATLAAVGELGVKRLNYLTDDPWNPAFRATWFFDALEHYDEVFSPRRANLDDLSQLGCGRVTYLPFGYDPELCFPQEPQTSEEWTRFSSELTFIGGADKDRIPYVDAAIRDGVDVALYGAYWDRFFKTRLCDRGHADVATVRKATRAAKVSLCLVRRANRDGHVMRSLEIPAMGGCMLAEDTQEHRALFGPPGTVATYFRTIPDMLDQLRQLLSAEHERSRLASAANLRIRDGRHTYGDRLQAMLSTDS